MQDDLVLFFIQHRGGKELVIFIVSRPRQSVISLLVGPCAILIFPASIGPVYLIFCQSMTNLRTDHSNIWYVFVGIGHIICYRVHRTQDRTER